jgi:hypothetical protein
MEFGSYKHNGNQTKKGVVPNALTDAEGHHNPVNK